MRVLSVTSSKTPARTAAFDPELYSLVHKGNPGDRRFYAGLAKDAKVLELGCGSGRILSAMLATATRVVGIDNNAGSVAEARSALSTAAAETASTAEVFCGDIAAFELPKDLLAQKFDVVVAPYSVLYCLPNDGLTSCFQQVWSYLRPGGAFAFDVWGADAFHAEFDEDEYPHGVFEALCEVESGGERVTISEASWWHRETQTVTASYRYQTAGATREMTIVHHYRLSTEFEQQLAACGFQIQRCLGGFEGGPFRADDPLLVVVAKRS